MEESRGISFLFTSLEGSYCILALLITFEWPGIAYPARGDLVVPAEICREWTLHYICPYREWAGLLHAV